MSGKVSRTRAISADVSAPLEVSLGAADEEPVDTLTSPFADVVMVVVIVTVVLPACQTNSCHFSVQKRIKRQQITFFKNLECEKRDC